jgi:23S rRNA pseudouridine955/2504/2580 synthase
MYQDGAAESMSYDTKPETVSPFSKVSHVTVDANEDGQRLDNWLIRVLKGVPRTRIYRILRKGEIRVNGKRAKPEQRVQTGDDIRLPPIRAAEPEAEGARGTRVPKSLLETIEASIVHEDEHMLVIGKPSGLAVHGGSGLSFGVIEALRASRPDETLELAHRLDRDTSGLLLVARHRSALRILHELLRDGLIEKRYLTLVKGSWDLGTKLIDAPLLTHTRTGGERTVRVAPNGKESSTTFAPVDFFGARATLLDVTLGTGRTHQIRVHAAHTGHPVSGDDKYGDREHNAAMAELGLKRLFLHSQSLSFEWPGSHKNYAFSLPLPADLAQVLENLAATRRKRSRRR